MCIHTCIHTYTHIHISVHHFLTIKSLLFSKVTHAKTILRPVGYMVLTQARKLWEKARTVQSMDLKVGKMSV